MDTSLCSTVPFRVDVSVVPTIASISPLSTNADVSVCVVSLDIQRALFYEEEHAYLTQVGQ